MEVFHVADLAEEGDDRQAHKAAVVGDHGLDGHERAFGEDDDHRLLRGGEVAHHGDHANDKGALRGIGDVRLLPVEQRDLGRLEDVAAGVALGGLDEEVGLDVAEDGKAERGPGRRVETAKLRNRQGVIAILREGDIEVRAERGGRAHADHGRAVAVVGVERRGVVTLCPPWVCTASPLPATLVLLSSRS